MKVANFERYQCKDCGQPLTFPNTTKARARAIERHERSAKHRKAAGKTPDGDLREMKVVARIWVDKAATPDDIAPVIYRDLLRARWKVNGVWAHRIRSQPEKPRG